METETRPCPECGAPIKPTATYCLACDTPVVDTERGLSVAEAVPVKMGRPMVGLLVAAGAAIALGGSIYGGFQYMHDRKVGGEAEAATITRDGVALVVRSESGRPTDCHHAPRYLAGQPANVRLLCKDVIGEDPGARLEHVHVGKANLAGKKGTVRLTATFVDHRGTRTLNHVFDVVQEAKAWRLSWDGEPVV